MIVLTSFGNSLTHGGLTHIAANSHVYSYIMVCISLVSVMLLTLSWCILYTSKGLSSSSAGAIRRSGSSSAALGLSMDPASDGYELARQQDDDDGMELSTGGAMMMRRSSSHHGLEWEEHRQLRHNLNEHEERGLLID